jgi:hypothetical protein
MRGIRVALPALFGLALSGIAAGADWVSLFNGKNLDGWEVRGDGIWTVMRDGTLLGQRDLTKKYEPKPEINQSWLYTKGDFGEFDLHLEWWTRYGGNSGVSLRDPTRARYALFGPEADKTRSPSHSGYEIQINNHYKDQYTTGSVYNFDKAQTGFQNDDDWNAFDIEVRDATGIKVKLNGHLVSQYVGAPGRPLRGPIGLQLHDENSVVMFRNIKIKEISRK